MFLLLQAAMLVPLRDTLTWRLHTKLHKFEWDTFPNNTRMKDHTDLNLGEAVYISIISQVLDFLIYWMIRIFIFDGMTVQTSKNKNHNHSINWVKKLGYERWLIYKQPRQVLSLYGFPSASYSEKCFAQIYRALYGVAMFVPLRGTQTWWP